MIIKFGQKEHMESLLNGNIYMNSMNYFKAFEDCSNIGDRDEGVLKILQPDLTEVTIGPIEYKKNGKVIKVPKYTLTKENGFVNMKVSKDTSHINLFCLYMISKEDIIKNDLKFTLPIEIKEDKNYEYCVVFLDPESFIKRINKYVKKKGHQFIGATLVEYVDKKTYHGEMGIFKKFKEYEHQNEYRVAIIPNSNSRGEYNEFIFNIGSLENIGVILKTSEVENLLRVEYKE